MLNIKYDENGLVPAIVQDCETGAVLMMAYMNAESLEKTLREGKTCFYSRSRGKLWTKGEESGHWQYVKSIRVDCDADTLLVEVQQVGAACHTENYSCFYRDLQGEEVHAPRGGQCDASVLQDLYATIEGRLANRVEGSYTNYLFDKGIDKICKKVGEEAAEVIIAAKNGSMDEVQYEAADLIYHLWVTLKYIGLTPQDIYRELRDRYKK